MMKSLATKALFAVGTATVALSAISAPAEALQITTSVGIYDVTTVEGTWNDLQTQLSQQIWFTGDLLQSTEDNNSALAEEFASLVNTGFNFPNAGGLTGPYFAFGTNTPVSGTTTRGNVGFANWSSLNSSAVLNSLDVVGNGEAEFNVSKTWAVATPIPTPALLPGLIGMGVAAWRKRKGEADATEA